MGSRAHAQQLWHTGLVAPWHVGSSQTRARTRVPCIGRWILNHCATREAPRFSSCSQSIPSWEEFPGLGTVTYQVGSAHPVLPPTLPVLPSPTRGTKEMWVGKVEIPLVSQHLLAFVPQGMRHDGSLTLTKPSSGSLLEGLCSESGTLVQIFGSSVSQCHDPIIIGTLGL